jgi:hypothetical protein
MDAVHPEPSLRALITNNSKIVKLSVAGFVGKLHCFLELKRSSLFSAEDAFGPCRKPAESSPHPHIKFN